MTTVEEPKQLFMAFVDRERQRAPSKKLSEAYRAVADQLGLKYDIVYQMYKGQPKSRPRTPSWETITSLLSAYKNEDDFSDLVARAQAAWKIDVVARHLGGDMAVYEVREPQPKYSGRLMNVRSLVVELAGHLIGLDLTDRKTAAVILNDLALSPDQADPMAAKLERLLGGSDHTGTHG